MTKAIEEKIRALSRAVLSEAQAEAEQTLASARTRVDAIQQQARQQAEAERAEILERAQQEADRMRSQAAAAARLKAQALRLERREKLLDSVFEAARQRLPLVQQWTDYDQIARHLVSEAVGWLGAGVASIQADERTMAILTDDVLAGITQEAGVQLKRGEIIEGGVGVIAHTADGHRRYDNTLEARLNRGQEALRAPVYRLLEGGLL